ncbi:replication protein A 70 kDa DNA-binding subunit A [Fagus crenata]
MDKGKQIMISNNGGHGGRGCNSNTMTGDAFNNQSELKILLCDSDPESCDEVSTLLTKCSYQVISVSSFVEVVDTLDAEGPLIDILLVAVDAHIDKGMKMLKYEGELVKIVVSKVLLELKKYYMVVTDNLVRIYHHEEEITKLFDIGFNGVRIVPIHGIGGIVKTTIAKVIYNKFSVLFDCCYFLPDVGETSQQHNGLLNLQNPHNAISALNPDQVRWAIKARVTAKGDIHCYNNDRGDGKVFSFDLLDSNGGEIRVTCFNAVVDRFYDAIEVGKVYLISKGSLKPAQKNFNHLKNEWEILLKATSTVELCLDEDGSIPRQQFSFRPISEIENAENNSILDIIGIVISVNPSMPIMKKNGMETQRRILNLKDGSGKSVELTLWGEFCNREGQQLQEMIDSGVFPVLAVKAGKINDFNGKSIESFSATQLFINPVLLPKSLQLQEFSRN